MRYESGINTFASTSVDASDFPFARDGPWADALFQIYSFLPLGWSRSGYWFVRLMNRFWTYAKLRLHIRVCSYIDDFLVLPSLRTRVRVATAADAAKASRQLDTLFCRFGLTRHPEKSAWGTGTTKLVHWGLASTQQLGNFESPSRTCTLFQRWHQRYWEQRK